MSDVTVVEKPSDAQGRVLRNTKLGIEENLTNALLFAEYEQRPAPEGSGKLNLLEYLSRGSKEWESNHGAGLQRKIDALRSQLDVVSAALDDWNERSDAYQAYLDDTEETAAG